jgi:hypothetical protein
MVWTQGTGKVACTYGVDTGNWEGCLHVWCGHKELGGLLARMVWTQGTGRVVCTYGVATRNWDGCLHVWCGHKELGGLLALWCGHRVLARLLARMVRTQGTGRVALYRHSTVSADPTFVELYQMCKISVDSKLSLQT